MVVGAHVVFAGRLGAFACGQYFELQARSQGGDAVTLGVLDQECLASGSSGFSLGGCFCLHHVADDLEAGRQVGFADAAVGAVEGVGQAGQDGFQADAWWRVVAQLAAQLTADAVADASFVGGQVEFGHCRAPLQGAVKPRP
ncbi:hypothetical protein D3C72_1401410 [compost metagenome]